MLNVLNHDRIDRHRGLVALQVTSPERHQYSVRITKRALHAMLDDAPDGQYLGYSLNAPVYGQYEMLVWFAASGDVTPDDACPHCKYPFGNTTDRAHSDFVHQVLDGIVTPRRLEERIHRHLEDVDARVAQRNRERRVA